MQHKTENRIREWRTHRSLSQVELAERIDTTAGTINKLETGATRLNTDWMERIAQALKCLPAELLPLDFYKPYLAPGEERILSLYRSLDDTEQMRWQKAFVAFCEPISPADIRLTD